jgi:arylsulfatase A-like enzyme
MVYEEIAKKFTALTYGSIAMIDDRVGKILDYLEKSGLAENTMVIYASDHGEYCGDHGLLLKGPAHFRGLINMPLLWKVPGLTKSSVSDSLVSTVDLPKTILSLLGMKEKRHPEIFHTGYDITPILEDPNNKLRKQLLIEHDEELKRNDSFRLRTLITETHRLTIYDGFENCGDIFNYEDDPGEVNNLWDKDSELKIDLTNRLMREVISLQPRLPIRKAQH